MYLLYLDTLQIPSCVLIWYARTTLVPVVKMYYETSYKLKYSTSSSPGCYDGTCDTEPLDGI
jgi:hypothetical protein